MIRRKRLSRMTANGRAKMCSNFYNFLLKALETFPPTSSAEARELAVRQTKAAINIPTHLSFDKLVTLDSVQALRESDAELFQLLEVFSGGELEDYVDFNDEHEGWLEDNGKVDLRYPYSS